MDEVVIADAFELTGDEYVWNNSEEKWEKYTGSAPTVPVGSATTSPETTDKQNSEYNGYFIFVK